MRGKRTFDYSSNNGIIVIGSGEAIFETFWTRGGGQSIYAYNDPPSIDSIALAHDAQNIADIRDARRYNYTSRHVTPREGQILLLKNTNKKFAAIKILDIKAVGYDGDAIDEITFDFLILQDGSHDFSVASDIQVTDNSFSKRVLLVGAGFSRNWGGLLVRDLTGRLMAHHEVSRRPRLRELLSTEPSFEDALEKSRTGTYREEDSRALESAIRDAFEDMDQGYKSPSPPVLTATINDFIGRFCPGPVGIGTGYVFSLNQDLLLERIYGTLVDHQHLLSPGIRWNGSRPQPPMAAYEIPSAEPVNPEVSEPSLLRNFNLIKLHGSINWRSSDGNSAIVLGRRKSQTITRTPLIEFYHRVFERVLADGDVRLMVIGYGWGDEHINEPIANAVRDHGLTVYFWDPLDPRVTLQGKHRGNDILKGWFGSCSRPMTEVMPAKPANPGSADYNAIVRDFFR